MCKVLIVPGIKSNYRENALLFMQAMGERMSVSNKDGLGYAAIDKHGNLFGERWLDNAHAFCEVITEPVDNGETKIIELFDNVLKSKNLPVKPATTEYSSFGNVNLDEVVAFTLHTRMATSGKGHANTHPFVDEDTSLIHNGIIRNSDKFSLKLSTCDSEALLISYLRNNINKQPQKVQDMADELIGYYVGAVFSRDNKGARILDVFKGNNNNLHVAYVAELGTYVMTSSEYDIKEVCNALGFSYSIPMDYYDGVLMRIDPFSGAMLSGHKFKPGEEFERVAYQPLHYSNYYSGAQPVTKLPKKKQMSKAEMDYYSNRPHLDELDNDEAMSYCKVGGCG